MSKKKKNPYKLLWFQATTLYTSLGLLFITGVLLGFRESLSAGFAVRLVRIHGYAVPLFLLSFGSLLAKHATLSWKANRNRPTGSLVTASCFILVLTGVLLYYLGGELSRIIALKTHLWVGLFLALLLPAHIIAGLLTRRKKEKTRMKKSTSH